MNSPVLVMLLVAAAAVGATNWATWRSAQAKPITGSAPAAGGGIGWDGLAAITTEAGVVRFPPALAAQAGREIELVGVLFPLPQLTEQGRLLGAVLAPPAKFSCCGLNCEARSLSLVLVIPAEAVADPGRRRLARVRGMLVLHRETGHWSPTELTAATIELLPDP